MKICIDAGHGGKDPGACDFDLQEKDIVLSIARKARDLLRMSGHEVIMSRSTDDYIGLSERAQLANNHGCDIFISVHVNAAANESANGFETFRYPSSQSGYKLQKYLHDALKGNWPTDRGLKEARFTVLSKTKMPAVLIECGFITNEGDMMLVKFDSGHAEIAKRLVKGVEAYALAK